MGFRQRLESWPVVGTALRVQERYVADGADPFAAAIGFFAFLSLFPLLLLAVSLAGFVLDDPADQLALAVALTEAVPGLDAILRQGEGAAEVAAVIEGVVAQRGTIGLVGGIVLLLSGLRVVGGAMIATRVVFRGAVLSGVLAKVRQVGALIGLGALALLGVAGSSLAGVGIGALPSGVSVLLSLVITFGFDFVLFLGAYALLSPTSSLTIRQLVPGAILAAVGWSGLKVAGASYVGNQVASANALYGALGGVFALMLLLYLAGRMYVYGAELTAVRVERLHGPLQSPAQPTSREDHVADRHPGRDERDTDGPPPPPRLAFAPRPVDPGPTGQAPTIGTGTREHLAVNEQRRRAELEQQDAGAEARHAIALGLGIAALAAGYRWLRSDRE